MLTGGMDAADGKSKRGDTGVATLAGADAADSTECAGEPPLPDHSAE